MPAKDAVLTAVTAMVDAVNHVDMAAARSWFSDNAVIVEDIPPYRWEGGNAVDDWLAAMAQSAAIMQVEAIVMQLGDSTRIDVADDRAYAIFPGTLKMNAGSQSLVAAGTLTFTLVADDERWIIDTLTWSGPNPRMS